MTYVEGYATGYMMPIHHVWLRVDGLVFDPTLRLTHSKKDSLATNRIWGDLGERQYIGVEFTDIKALARRVVETELFQSVIDDWQNDGPALKGTYAKEDRERLVTENRSAQEG